MILVEICGLSHPVTYVLQSKCFKQQQFTTLKLGPCISTLNQVLHIVSLVLKYSLSDDGPSKFSNLKKFS